MATPSTVSVPEVSPLQLAVALEAGDDVQVLDVRLPEKVAAARIDLVPASRFHNIPVSDILQRTSLDGTGIDRDALTVVLCTQGNTSVLVADHLVRLGYRAASLRGGLGALMSLVRAREVTPPPSLDRFVQFDRVAKGALGYLLVSGEQALAVDPPRDFVPLVDAARAANAQIVAVADTHMHADYVSGARMLSRMLGVPYYLHPRDAVSPYDGSRGLIDLHPIDDGDAIHIGRCAVRVVHTPGHTEGSVCYIIDNMAALTGDFLFPTSVGRPDLGGKAADWTELLWRSLQAARHTWPDDLVIYPAHYSSSRERRADGIVAARFADALKATEELSLSDPAAFRNAVLTRIGTFPESYRTIKALNLGLIVMDEERAEELEVGRSECAIPKNSE